MLAKAQTIFANALLAVGEPHADAVALVRDGAVSPTRRIEIYRHNVLFNLVGALRDIYPIVERVVGEEFFQAAAKIFVRATPSTSGDLNDFGFEWPEFLRMFPPAAELPYLSDVARLEWAWHESFHAADAPPFDAHALTAIPAEQHGALRFQLHPAVRLIASTFPTADIWRVNQPDYDGDMRVDWDQNACQLLLRREQTIVTMDALPAAEFRFFSALSCNAPLQAATDAALAVDAAFDLAATLQRAVVAEIICAFNR